MAEEEIELWLEEDFGERIDAGSVDCSNEHGSAEFVDRWRSLLEEEESGDLDIDIGKEVERKERKPRELAVVERDLPPGLFGFTRRDSSHVVVNRNLYKVDRERTIEHEKTHHRSPKDELTIRYINGDIDVENTLSFRADNPGWPGVLGRAASRPGTAAYSSSETTYSESY
ncbi:MAG: hypothetical protein MUP63_01125 [Candidatus Nanohaloarchaeota archaeon QJJ-7]|nr:hypothetical protein [Candidatus Nanohaloarchaeota archaeon QJJ-7]